MATNKYNEPVKLIAFLNKHKIDYVRNPDKTGTHSVVVIDIPYHFDELHTPMENPLNAYNNY